MESVTSAKKIPRNDTKVNKPLKTEPALEKKENLKMNETKKEPI